MQLGGQHGAEANGCPFAELKEAAARRKQLEQQWRQEEQLVQATRTWVSDVLPRWETARHQRRTQELWWQGIPPSVRGHVWKLAVGNELNITSELYEICASRSRQVTRADDPDRADTRENSAHLIRLDVSRTFPQLGIFQEVSALAAAPFRHWAGAATLGDVRCS